MAKKNKKKQLPAPLLYESLFSDLGEQGHVFDMLDEWASAPENTDLPDLYSDQAFVRKQVARIAQAVSETETRHGVTPGASGEAEDLDSLDRVLARTRTASDLRAVLPELKELLFKAHIIGEHLRLDALVPLAERAQSHSQVQSQKAHKAAEKRWKGNKARTEVGRIIGRLAGRCDELGDWVPPDELWGELWGELDKAGFREPEELENPRRYEHPDLPNGGVVDYENHFARQIRRLRKKR